MKELSIEQKAKAYDEAIERARAKYAMKDQPIHQYLVDIFPELAESESEKIRKEIIQFLKIKLPDWEEFKDYSSWIEWLEKQGEQKETLCDKCKKTQPSHSCQDITELGRCAVEQEQKTAEWSEEDEAAISRVISIVKWAAYSDHSHPILNDKGATELVERLNSLKDRVQPKQEWSEEDERDFDVIYGIIYNSCSAEDASRLITFLKSLRPQKQWRPSLAQLNALSIVSKGNAPDDIEAIVSLYNDLKKLKE